MSSRRPDPLDTKMTIAQKQGGKERNKFSDYSTNFSALKYISDFIQIQNAPQIFT